MLSHGRGRTCKQSTHHKLHIFVLHRVLFRRIEEHVLKKVRQPWELPWIAKAPNAHLKQMLGLRIGKDQAGCWMWAANKQQCLLMNESWQVRTVQAASLQPNSTKLVV